MNSGNNLMITTGTHSQVVIGRVGRALVVTTGTSTHKFTAGVQGVVTLGRDDELFNVFFFPVRVVMMIGGSGSVDPLEG